MLVGPILPEDHAAVGEIARATGSELDVAAELDRGWARLWVARLSQNAPPAAFLLAWDVADELHVIHVATHPNWRRRGAGHALISALLSHARSRRTRLVLLEVRRSNRAAIRLYRAHGFCAIGLRRGYYRGPGELESSAGAEEDAVEMMLELDPNTGAAVTHHDAVALGAFDEAEPTATRARPFPRRN